MIKIKQYEQNDYTPVPGRLTLFLRKCLVWQIIQFVWINIKMTILILKSHH